MKKYKVLLILIIILILSGCSQSFNPSPVTEEMVLDVLKEESIHTKIVSEKLTEENELVLNIKLDNNDSGKIVIVIYNNEKDRIRAMERLNNMQYEPPIINSDFKNIEIAYYGTDGDSVVKTKSLIEKLKKET